MARQRSCWQQLFSCFNDNSDSLTLRDSKQPCLVGELVYSLSSLGLGSDSQGASLGNLLLKPTYPIEKTTLWIGLLCLTSQKTKFCPTWKSNQGERPSRLSTNLWLHPVYSLEGYFNDIIASKAVAASSLACTLQTAFSLSDIVRCS